jgi:hypothetical protein
MWGGAHYLAKAHPVSDRPRNPARRDGFKAPGSVACEERPRAVGVPMKNAWKDYNLSIVLFALFIVSWIGQTYVGWVEFVGEQQEHGQTAQWLGEGGYLWAWAQATLENWQSEFLQLFCMVVLTAFLIHKGSAESKDSNDRMEQVLQRIERRLAALEKN